MGELTGGGGGGGSPPLLPLGNVRCWDDVVDVGGGGGI